MNKHLTDPGSIQEDLRRGEEDTNERLRQEVAERKLAQHQLESSNEILRIATQAVSGKEYLDGAVELFRRWSGCTCVGIRVLDEEGNIPYPSHVGFDAEFLNTENRLSIHKDQCACIRMVTGETEPPDTSCISPGGSFVLNDSGQFAKTLSEEELQKFRGVCIASGFMSVALIPIRDQDRVLGVIHLADKKPYMLPGGLIGLFEGLAPLVGEGIRKFNASDALKRHHELLQGILDVLPVGVWITNKKGKIIKGNPAGQSIWKGARYVGVERYGEYKAWRFETGKRIKAQEWGLARALREGEASLNEVIEIECFDGSRRIILNSAAPVRDEQKNILAAIAVNQDITRMKEAEEQLKHYAEELQSTNRELQDFAHIASHDLREPLRKIQYFSDLICRRYDDALDDSGKEVLRRLQGAAGRMQALLNGLLAYSHVTTRANPIKATDLAILAEEVVSDLELFIERKGAKVHIGELPIAEVDATQFMQLLQNLISNGLKYNENENPEVRVTSEIYQNGIYRICVEDNGIGFDEHFLARIFQPFQRLHGRGSKFEGTGMGLPICRKIVERHGGTITAESTPGKGSRFIITLPVKLGRGRVTRDSLEAEKEGAH